MVDNAPSAQMKSIVGIGSSLPFASFESGWDAISTSVDVSKYRLRGDVRAPHDFENHNYVGCIFDGNLIAGFHMLHMDFKDCTFILVRIESSKIESCAFVNCIFERTTFSSGQFHNCTFQDCRFFDCRFTDFDLGNAFIKGCRVSENVFTRCMTDNHVFEECLFSKPRFEDCELQIDTVLKNYGLSHALMAGCTIRDRRLREGGTPMTPDQIKAYSPPDHDLIAGLRLEYFRADTFLHGSTALDECLTNGSWLTELHNDFAIGDKIGQFVEFLVNLWERNELPCHALLLAHDMTRQLIEALQTLEDEQEYYRVLLAVMGTHMVLARKIERFLIALEHLQDILAGRPFVLIVNGPADPDFYRNYLPELFCTGDTRILAAKPHNSPSELFLCGITALAWFLASLERFSLETYVAAASNNAATATTAGSSNSGTALALCYKKGGAFELRARAAVPFSSLVVDLDIAVSTTLIGRFRDLVVKMLQPEAEERKE